MERVLHPGTPEGQAVIGAERPSRSNRERPEIRIGSKAALDAQFRIEGVFLA
jgi:hypothetical protein